MTEETFFNHQCEKELKKLEGDEKQAYETKRDEWRNKIRQEINQELKDKKTIDECITDIAMLIHGLKNSRNVVEKSILESLFISLSHLI